MFGKNRDQRSFFAFVCRFFIFVVMTTGLIIYAASVSAGHPFGGAYDGRNLDRIAFPIGGIGSGMFCLEGTGAISHLSVRHQMERFNEPFCFAAISIQNGKGANIARVLEAPVPDWKRFGTPSSGLGSPGTTYGLPRFRQGVFQSEFPFCRLALSDSEVPIDAELIGWSPFIPGDSARSSLPVGALEYKLTNRGAERIDAVFSFHARNFFGQEAIRPAENGFLLPAGDGAFSFSLRNETETAVDHCWFRGGWWDAFSILWQNIADGAVIANRAERENTPGASLYLPIRIEPGESRTIQLMAAWYFPTSSLHIGQSEKSLPLAKSPAKGTAQGQQPVGGYRGKGLVNTFAPNGDAHIGQILSPSFEINRRYLHFLAGGGRTEKVGVWLTLGNERPLSVRGTDAEQLRWVSWDLAAYRGKSARIEIDDFETAGWGHINADHFVLSDLPLDEFLNAESGKKNDANDAILLADFEGDDYDDWEVIGESVPADGESPDTPEFYTPWYAVRFGSIDEVTAAFRDDYDALRGESLAFAETMRKAAFPPELREAVEANLTILKSPTILRQQDGRLWGWEGNNDVGGSCAGSCTHVWNYAQSLCHLFHDLERTLRETEFFDGLEPDGRQAFRFNLPITPGGIAWDASDGLLGTIMKVHREWKISGDADWLRRFWPRTLKAMNWAISHWDPERTGLLQKSHHNTYDINYLGPEGHCGSFYLGALTAVVKMGSALGEDVSEYAELLARGRLLMESELFNGEYFIQRVPTPGSEGNPDGQSEYYRAAAETVDRQGPKYQYGDGCLSDGVLGFWMAKVCGIDDDIIDPKKIESHLLAVHRYNLKTDLSTHANPQRPSFALGGEGGLLLCTWPKGNRPLLPFVYSDEVWTGIEYQVASHLMMFGRVNEGLEIVRCCRARYDGVRRNPFNEYECGHWYARAMSSYALIQGYSGLRYDAAEKTLLADRRPYDYTVPLFTDAGSVLVHYHAGDLPSLEIEPLAGEVRVEQTVLRE